MSSDTSSTPSSPMPPAPSADLLAPPSPPRPGRFTSEVMAGGSVDEHDDSELVGGWRGAAGVAGLLALFAWLAATNIWWFVFAMGLLICIFLHELGHFVTARWTGMKATQFFIGFGPRLWSFRSGETEYGVRALPLGAFVRIIGMNEMDEVPTADRDRTYMSKSFPRRLLVISAGSIMHMLIAIVLLFTVYVADGEPTVYDGAAVPAAGAISPVTGAALAAGLEPNDVVIAIGDTAVTNPSELGEAVRTYSAGDQVEVTYLRGGATPATADTLTTVATLGSSLAATDVVLAINLTETDPVAVSQLDGELIASAVDDATAGAATTVAIQTGTTETGEPIAQFVPAVVGEVNGNLVLEGTALLGLSTGFNSVNVEHSVAAAAGNAVVDIFPAAYEMVGGVVKVLNPVNIYTHLAGTNDDLTTRPTTLVGVTAVSDDVGESQGLVGVLYLLAVLNVFIGVFNMFPLLPLDGGHAAVATYERIREAMSKSTERYHADMSKLTPYAMGFIVLLGFLFMSGLYLDITQPL